MLHTSEHCCSLIANALLQRHWQLATAESCSGGMIAAACTDLAGSSQWFERGFVSYSNQAKTEMLGVSPSLIERFGAVSEQTALAMAHGAIQHACAQVALAVTGIAGPSGACSHKPVGTVWFAWITPLKTHSELMHFSGDRNQVRIQTVLHSLQNLHSILNCSAP